MARGSKADKSAKTEAWYESSENKVTLSGCVKRVLYEGEKVLIFTLETVIKTPKGNYSHQFIRVKTFDPEVEVAEGDEVGVTGYISTDSYENKKTKATEYVTEVIANEVMTED